MITEVETAEVVAEPSLARDDARPRRFDRLREQLARPGLHGWLIALVSVIVYANSLASGFAYDDWWIIYNNPRLHQLRDLGQIVGTPYWPNNGEMLGLYRPLTVLGFAVQWVLTDGVPTVFHAINVLMHAGVSVLVWRLLRHFGSPGAAFAGALLFAVHPLHTEAAANIVGQAELWAGLSVVGGSLVFLGRDVDAPLGLRRLLAIAGLYAMGLFAKEHSIVLPGLLVALEAARSTGSLRDYLRRHMGWIVPSALLLAAVAGAYLSIRYGVLGSITGTDAGPQYPFLREEYRVFSALRAWPEYMRLLFFPVDLSADYSPGVIIPVEGAVTPMMLLGAGILAGLVLLACATYWRPRAGLPAAWFFITVLPVSNLLFPIGVLLAERILYLPSVALGFVVAFAWDALLREREGESPAAPLRRRRAARLILAGTTVALAALTIARNPVWKSSETVVDSIIRDHPESYRAQWNAGALAYHDGDTATAVYHWELAHRMWRRDSNLLNDIAGFYLTTNDFPRAVSLLRDAYALEKESERVTTSLTIAELGVGNFPEALRLAEEAIAKFGANPVFFDLRARALAGLGMPEHAVASWRVGIRLGADGWIQWAQMARALGEMDSTRAALAALDTSIARVRAFGDAATASQLEQARAGLLR